jgi:hypothetical protein
MNEKLKRLEDEIENEYIARIYRNKCEYELTNMMCKEVINKELGTDYAESTLRGIAKIFNETYELISERLLNRDNDEYLKELEDKKKELEIMKIQFQDQKREYRNYLRMDARWQHIINEMSENILKLNEYKPITPIENLKINGDREAVLILSDWHIGMVNNTRHNVYNIEIAKERMETLYNKVIKYCNLHSTLP